MPRAHGASVAFLGPIFAMAVLVGCGDAHQGPDFVARVNDQLLTRAEIDDALGTMPVRLDTVDARRQVVEQWVTNALLFQEATRRGLRNNPEVQRLLAESERSVMVSALLSRLYEEEDEEPSDAEVQTYFDRNKDLFRIREPFVLVRHLAASSADSATAAGREMRTLGRTSAADSQWIAIVDRYGIEADAALELSSSHLPESRLFSSQRELHEALRRLQDGQVSEVIRADGRYHVIQLLERVAPGAIPELSWVESDLRRRLVVQSRKQIYARHVQRLRNEALAREDLEIR